MAAEKSGLTVISSGPNSSSFLHALIRHPFSIVADTKYLKDPPIFILQMIKQITVIGLAMSILVVITGTESVAAQNLTENMSSTMGNASQSANQTMTDLGTNASSATNQTGEAMNATATELGQNASDLGETVLNKTAEVATTVGSGAADVIGNISGEIKEGVGAK